MGEKLPTRRLASETERQPSENFWNGLDKTGLVELPDRQCAVRPLVAAALPGYGGAALLFRCQAGIKFLS